MKDQKTPLPTGISKPATRALHNQGYYYIEDLASLTEAELLSLHGLGPKAIPVLKQALKEQGLELAAG